MIKFLFTLSIILLACSKEPMPLPRCGEVIQMRRVYNNTVEWRYVRTDVVKNFGVFCGDSLQYYVRLAADSSEICIEPWKLYWKINYK